MSTPCPPGPALDLVCCINVSSIVLSTPHMFAGINNLATLIAPNFRKSVVLGEFLQC